MSIVKLFFVAFASLAMACAADESSKAREDAHALIDDLIARQPAANSQMVGTLKMRNEDGRRREIPLRYTVVLGADVWQGIYETQQTTNTPAETLVVQHRSGSTNEYMLERAGEKPRRISGEDSYAPYATSDFWIGDLGLEFLHWPSQQVVKREMRKGRSCRVVESINPNPSSTGYARVLSWIDVETAGLIRAEGYDAQGKLWKEFSIRGFKKINGHWELQEMEIRNEKTDSRTRLEFNLQVK